jgi:hypothetical protein
MCNYQFNIEPKEVTLAKIYMYEYKYLIEWHKIEIGIIGRFFEKLFGTDFYSNLEITLCNEYHINWYDAYEILVKSKNEKYIYEYK